MDLNIDTGKTKVMVFSKGRDRTTVENFSKQTDLNIKAAVQQTI